MPEGQRSETTKLVFAIVESLEEDIKIVAEELYHIPYMQEQVTKAEYQRRFRAMTPQQRLDEMRRLGTPEVLRLMSPGAM